MRGDLFVYSAEKRLVAFQSGAERAEAAGVAEDVVVFIGGLSDGFLATPYVEALGAALSAEAGWSLVQARRRRSPSLLERGFLLGSSALR